MFVFSVKAEKKVLAVALVCVLAVVGMVTLGLCLPAKHVSGKAVSFKATTAEERLALLHDLGHETAADSETVREIRLPDEPDDVLIAYEQLQLDSGLGLLKYSGKRVKLYTYTVTNAQSDKAEAHLYCYRDRVVAGDITVNGEPMPLFS